MPYIHLPVQSDMDRFSGFRLGKRRRCIPKSLACARRSCCRLLLSPSSTAAIRSSTLPTCSPATEFAADSALEEAGFEPPVPRELGDATETALFAYCAVPFSRD